MLCTLWLVEIICFCAKTITFVDGKRQKKLFLHQKHDFDQQTACGAPVCLSKYTTQKASFTSCLQFINFQQVKRMQSFSTNIIQFHFSLKVFVYFFTYQMTSMFWLCGSYIAILVCKHLHQQSTTFIKFTMNQTQAIDV